MPVKKKYLLLPLVLFSLLAIPHLRRWKELGRNYTTLLLDGQGTTQTSFEETYAYASLANRFKFSQPINDVGTFEYRNSASPLISELMPAAIVGTIAKFVDVPAAVILVKIIFPVLLVMVWYAIGIKIGLLPANSQVASLATVFLPQLYVLIPYFRSLTYLTDPQLEFQRIFHPLISGLMMAAAILLIIMGLNYLSNTRLKILTGISFGLLFYTYIFSWALAIGAMGLLLISFMVEKDWKKFKWLLTVLGLGLLVAFPYFINAWLFHKSVLSPDFWAKSVYLEKQNYLFVMLRCLALITGMILINRQWYFSAPRRLLIFLLFSATALPVISQIILGVNLEADHWIIRFFYPVSTYLMIGTAGELILKYFSRVSKIFVGLTLALVLIRILSWEFTELKKPIGDFQLSPARRELYAWMDKNIKQESVLGSLSFVEEIYLTAYTPYYPNISQTFRTLATTDEILNRYLYLTQIMQFKSDYFNEMLRVPLSPLPFADIPSQDQRIYATIFGLKYYHDTNPYPIHQKLIESIKEKQEIPISANGRLDYLLITPTDRFYSSRDFKKECDTLFDNGTYQLYLFYNCLNNEK